MLRLWGRTNSSNVMKVLWLLDELALPFERLDAGMAFGVVSTPEYLAMNPYGLVPVLQDGPQPCSRATPSCAISRPRYGTPLYPAEPGPRAEIECWMDAQLATMPPLGLVFRELVRTPPERRDEARLAQALDDTAAATWVCWTRCCASAPTWPGDALTLADLAFGALVHRWFALPIARPDTKALRAYYNRLLDRPAYAEHCAKPLS